MPVIIVNEHPIRYEIFGSDRSDQVPILLIQGAPLQSSMVREKIIPALERQFRVISLAISDSQPTNTDSISGSFFNEANLLAVFLRKLGYQNVHLIACGEGINLALATMLKHQEVIQSTVLLFSDANIHPALARDPDLSKIHCATLLMSGYASKISLTREALELTEQICTAESWSPEMTDQRSEGEYYSAVVEALSDFLIRRGEGYVAPWAIIKRPVNDLRHEPGNRSERLSQALLGEAVQIFDTQEDWTWVRMESDNYFGWIQTAALEPISRQALLAYQESCNARVLVDFLSIWDCENSKRLPFQSTTVVGRIPFGTPLLVEEWDEETVRVRLPDRSERLARRAELLPAANWPKPDEAGIHLALKLFTRFIGIPYLWGGRTPYGFDCSGLSQAFLNFLGIHAPRDADMQYRAGIPVEGEPLAGDLFFFGDLQDSHSQRFSNISHVAISLGGADMFHSNGAAWGISYNSLDPDSQAYRAWLHDHLQGARRFR